MKRLITLPYTPGRVAFPVHRVGNSLVIDGGVGPSRSGRHSAANDTASSAAAQRALEDVLGRMILRDASGGADGGVGTGVGFVGSGSAGATLPASPSAAPPALPGIATRALPAPVSATQDSPTRLRTGSKTNSHLGSSSSAGWVTDSIGASALSPSALCPAPASVSAQLHEKLAAATAAAAGAALPSSAISSAVSSAVSSASTASSATAPEAEGGWTPVKGRRRSRGNTRERALLSKFLSHSVAASDATGGQQALPASVPPVVDAKSAQKRLTFEPRLGAGESSDDAAGSVADDSEGEEQDAGGGSSLNGAASNSEDNTERRWTLWNSSGAPQGGPTSADQSSSSASSAAASSSPSAAASAAATSALTPRHHGGMQRREKNLRQPHPHEPPHPFRQVVHWQLQDLGMLLGTDHLVFSSLEHPAMSLQLCDMRRPIRPLSILEFWLDNVMSAIPALAVCGRVKLVSISSTAATLPATTLLCHHPAVVSQTALLLSRTALLSHLPAPRRCPGSRISACLSAAPRAPRRSGSPPPSATPHRASLPSRRRRRR